MNPKCLCAGLRSRPAAAAAARAYRRRRSSLPPIASSSPACRALPELCCELLVPEALLERAAAQRYLGVICMVVKLRRALSPYYVLNLTDPGLPFTGVIGLTTLVDPQEVGGYHLCLPAALPRPTTIPIFKSPTRFYAPFMAGASEFSGGAASVLMVVVAVFRTRFVSLPHVLRYDELWLPIRSCPASCIF